MQKGLITSPHQVHPSTHDGTHHPGLEHEHQMEEQKAEPLWTSARLHGRRLALPLPRMELCPDRAGGVANNDRVQLGRESNCTFWVTLSYSMQHSGQDASPSVPAERILIEKPPARRSASLR
jgi:hypothetical protein